MNDVPALLPEIWLHWDPKTLRQRGAPAMPNLRMDFLMLLPGTRRVVLEVDGMQHYTRNEGTEPDSAKYAATMAADRDLKLHGYEVFRFGHDELRDRDRPLLARFFNTLVGTRPSASSAAVRPKSAEQESSGQPGCRALSRCRGADPVAAPEARAVPRTVDAPRLRASWQHCP
ncbi:hypothetical protein [Streptomyces sp. NBC_01264]|uniref:hypothetical protein n=1 Tax=Streptomyces sp. NBC_01264 TaxID=2903804 RepID=UPI002259C042|nr:hypothetical protein [Streptomyces sp. NBC_01264]MCX4784341.1 endonuclease domain-containing protein [Streptomyces sp. NBC_01264]